MVARISVDGLADFRTILDFNETSGIVAVVSHPGWKSHLRLYDALYPGIVQYMREQHGLGGGAGLKRAKQFSIGLLGNPMHYLNGRHIHLEAEMFQYLAKHNIPTIVTVPVKTHGGRHSLTEVVSEDFPNFLRDLRGKRDNVYILPTNNEPEDEKEGLASGKIFGHTRPDSKFSDLASKFQTSVSGKTVLFTGSNIFHCVDETLGYLRPVQCSVLVLMNYCGLADEQIKEFGDIKFKSTKSSIIESIKTNPEEPALRRRLAGLFPLMMQRLETLASQSESSNPADMTCFDGYVADLRL